MSISKNKLKTTDDLRQAAINAHQNGNLEDAKKLYQAYLHNKPKDAAIWSNLGSIFRKQKNYDLAAATQTRALELEPTSPSVMNNAANAYYDAGNILKSMELRRTLVKLEPENPEQYSSLGKCYRGIHQLDKAEVILA